MQCKHAIIFSLGSTYKYISKPNINHDINHCHRHCSLLSWPGIERSVLLFPYATNTLATVIPRPRYLQESESNKEKKLTPIIKNIRSIQKNRQRHYRRRPSIINQSAPFRTKSYGATRQRETKQRKREGERKYRLAASLYCLVCRISLYAADAAGRGCGWVLGVITLCCGDEDIFSLLFLFFLFSS